jgi:hypothetical protein
MPRPLTALLAGVLLWAPFTVASLAAAVVSAIGLTLWAALGDTRVYAYTKNLLGGMDRVASAVLGLEARYTVSAHCGTGKLPLLRKLLDRLFPGHCLGAARNEGLVE